jgi:hypothetical protein
VNGSTWMTACRLMTAFHRAAKIANLADHDPPSLNF